MLGLYGTKIGMTQIFEPSGVLTPVTAIRIDPNPVVALRSEEKNGYTAVVVGHGSRKPSRTTKPYAGQFPEGVAPTAVVRELRDFDGQAEPGGSLDVSLFESVGFVDVIGTSKGKGNQGVMKRHGFGGGRKTHGSKFHRENGSTGMAAFPSRVIKGTKMAGRMGGERVTVQNLRVVRVDAERGLLLVEGSVPGPRNSRVLVRRSKKRG